MELRLTAQPQPFVCTISIESHTLRQRLDEVVAAQSYDRLCCVHDPAVEKLAVAIAGDRDACLAVTGGESAKSLATVETLARRLLEVGGTRRSVLVALGGGVVTDVAGLLAALYMRGVDCVHVPTTLLGMVDAAIGGKNGVHLGPTKNILGTIQQPRAVLIDPGVLESLPPAAMREGLVEAVKVAGCLDTEFFAWLERSHRSVESKDEAALQHAIERAVELKIGIVESDEREQGLRRVLNFGHTVGHAIEAVTGFQVSHGAAVSIGMSAEMRMAGCPTEDVGRMRRLLAAIEMPTTIPAELDGDAMWGAMLCDKKTVGGEVRVAVPDGLGRHRVSRVTRASLDDCLG